MNVCHGMYNVKAIATKIAKNVGLLSRISYLIPQHVRKSLYYTLIYPYFSYGNIVWASTYPTSLRKLLLLQKKAIRLIARDKKYSHTENRYYEYKILKFDNINLLQTGIFMYKYFNKLLPKAFPQLFTMVTDVHTHFTRSATGFSEIYVRTNYCWFSLRSRGPKLWNKIPFNIKKAKSLGLFKRGWATYLKSTVV
jgi:hypothetical protein